jgi:hypothetical protein
VPVVLVCAPDGWGDEATDAWAPYEAVWFAKRAAALGAQVAVLRGSDCNARNYVAGVTRADMITGCGHGTSVSFTGFKREILEMTPVPRGKYDRKVWCPVSCYVGRQLAPEIVEKSEDAASVGETEEYVFWAGGGPYKGEDPDREDSVLASFLKPEALFRELLLKGYPLLTAHAAMLQAYEEEARRWEAKGYTSVADALRFDARYRLRWGRDGWTLPGAPAQPLLVVERLDCPLLADPGKEVRVTVAVAAVNGDVGKPRILFTYVDGPSSSIGFMGGSLPKGYTFAWSLGDRAEEGKEYSVSFRVTFPQAGRYVIEVATASGDPPSQLVHDRRRAEVYAGVKGKLVVEDSFHPVNASAGAEFPWHAVARVSGAPVVDPFVSYSYLDGPADSVELVLADGSRARVAKGGEQRRVWPGAAPPDRVLDSREAFRGVAFPQPGTYKIRVSAGAENQAHASMDFQVSVVSAQPVAVTVRVESAGPESGVLRHHGLTVDRSLPPRFWEVAPETVIGSTDKGWFSWQKQFALYPGDHYLEYGVSAPPEKAWKAYVYVGGQEAGSGYVHEQKNLRATFTVKPAAPPPGRFVVKEWSHPTSAAAGQEVSWYAVGEARDGSVTDPFVSYSYLDGPAGSVTLVRADGTALQLPKGGEARKTWSGALPQGSSKDSREAFRGVVFPQPGAYKVRVSTGAGSQVQDYRDATVGVSAPQVQYACPFCDYTAGTKEALKNHVLGAHLQPCLISSGDARKCLNCPIEKLKG